MSSNDEIDDALDFIEESSTYEKKTDNGLIKPTGFVRDESEEPRSSSKGQVTQYELYGSGFAPTPETVKRLPPGCYDIKVSEQKGAYASPSLPPTGLLLELPEMRSEHVIKIVDTFWNSESDYKEGNQFVIGGAAFKSGIMIYGPPGSGKSCTLKLVMNKLVKNGGIVFYANSMEPYFVNSFLESFNRIEPNRKSIVVLEDFDSLIDRFGETQYLEMLDSAKTINNVLFIATTNYPDRLDPRIYNRPGRFSHVVKIGLPPPAARKAYLEAILKDHRDVDYIVKNSEGFTIDHLTSLINGVYREKKNLETEVERLRTLFKVPVVDNSKSIGFVE